MSKPLNTTQARILRIRINATKALVFQLQDDLGKLARLHDVECARMVALRDAFSRARAALEDGDDACVGVEIDSDIREPVTRLRFR